MPKGLMLGIVDYDSASEGSTEGSEVCQSQGLGGSNEYITDQTVNISGSPITLSQKIKQSKEDQGDEPLKETHNEQPLSDIARQCGLLFVMNVTSRSPHRRRERITTLTKSDTDAEVGADKEARTTRTRSQPEACTEEMVRAYMRARSEQGYHLMKSIRENAEFHNPHVLAKAAQLFHMSSRDQRDSNYPPALFDPHGPACDTSLYEQYLKRRRTAEEVRVPELGRSAAPMDPSTSAAAAVANSNTSLTGTHTSASSSTKGTSHATTAAAVLAAQAVAERIQQQQRQQQPQQQQPLQPPQPPQPVGQPSLVAEQIAEAVKKATAAAAVAAKKM